MKVYIIADEGTDNKLHEHWELVENAELHSKSQSTLWTRRIYNVAITKENLYKALEQNIIHKYGSNYSV